LAGITEASHYRARKSATRHSESGFLPGQWPQLVNATHLPLCPAEKSWPLVERMQVYQRPRLSFTTRHSARGQRANPWLLPARGTPQLYWRMARFWLLVG